VQREKSGKYNNTRYGYVNFHSMFRSGTLEVRLHTGTANPIKIMNWANLHAKLIDFCLSVADDGKSIEKILMPISEEEDMKSKTIMLFELLNLKNESIDYFIKRQNAFMVESMNDNEENN
jgi:hypothetical protein